MVKPLLMDPAAGLLKKLKLVFYGRSPHSPFTLFVPRQTYFQGNMEQEKHAGDMVFPRQGKQASTGPGRQGRRINDTQPVDADSLFHDEMNQRERLLVEALVPFVVGNQRAAPVGGDDLAGSKVPGGEIRLAAGRRTAQNDEARPRQPNQPSPRGGSRCVGTLTHVPDHLSAENPWTEREPLPFPVEHILGRKRPAERPTLGVSAGSGPDCIHGPREPIRRLRRGLNEPCCPKRGNR